MTCDWPGEPLLAKRSSDRWLGRHCLRVVYLRDSFRRQLPVKVLEDTAHGVLLSGLMNLVQDQKTGHA